MDSRTQVMVALGAAVGVNCIPCFDHLYGKAREVGLSESEIKEVVQTAFKVKSGASAFLKQAIDEQVGATEDAAAACCGSGKECAC